MSEEQEQKPSEYLIGLVLGTAVAAGTWFLYKTKKGERLRSWWEKYFNELKEEWQKLQEQTAEPVKKSPQRVRSKPALKKLTFHKSGQSLLK